MKARLPMLLTVDWKVFWTGDYAVPGLINLLSLKFNLRRPVAGYVNLCPEGISTKSFDEHQMHFTIKHEILHALVGLTI